LRKCINANHPASNPVWNLGFVSSLIHEVVDFWWDENAVWDEGHQGGEREYAAEKSYKSELNHLVHVFFKHIRWVSTHLFVSKYLKFSVITIFILLSFQNIFNCRIYLWINQRFFPISFVFLNLIIFI
jgi:hypothetical protein